MILSAEGIAKRFEARPVLRDASLSVASGEFVHLSGSNGSGKTTLARIMATLLTPDRGTVSLDERPVERHRAAVRRAIGFASHRPLLYLGLTPVENLVFFGRLTGLTDARDRAVALLARFGLSGRADTPIEVFSRGMLQRVVLSRALLSEPEVLILDEPYAGLDHSGVQTLNEILAERSRRGAGVLVISHERDHVEPLKPREALLDGGRVEYVS